MLSWCLGDPGFVETGRLKTARLASGLIVSSVMY